MAVQSFIRVPPDSTGKKVDMCQLTIGSDTVERQRVQLAGDASDAIAGITVSGGVPVSPAITSLARDSASSISLAAGGSDNLDSTTIPSSLTGKLVQILVSGSVPFKAELTTVQDNVAASSIVTIISRDLWDFKPVSKNQITISYSASIGFDGFRIIVTNLDTSESANFYATFFYDLE